jgi:hypothetical protein
MASYLKVRGWGGCKRISITVLSSAGDDFRVQVEEAAYLPGRGALKKGQSILVPKGMVTQPGPAVVAP